MKKLHLVLATAILAFGGVAVAEESQGDAFDAALSSIFGGVVVQVKPPCADDPELDHDPDCRVIEE